MANFIDYCVWRGDVPISSDGFNEVDSLILSELAYLKADTLIPSLDSEEWISLKDLHEQYQSIKDTIEYPVNNPNELFDAMVQTNRFQNVKVGRYISIIDQEVEAQFAAMTFWLDDDTYFLAFRGTDGSFVGWKEDFNFSFQQDSPSQMLAKNYVNDVLKNSDKKVRIGGHSKGGNLAIYGAVFSSVPSKQILHIYSHDGPGFLKEVVDREEFKTYKDHISNIIPEASMIGILMNHSTDFQVIKSNAIGANQHHPYTWQVLGTKFELADKRRISSYLFDETIEQWIEEIPLEERKEVIQTVYEAIVSTGYTNIDEIKQNPWKYFNALMKAKIEPEKQKQLLTLLQKLAKTSGNVIWDEAQNTFNKILNKEENQSDKEDKS